MVQSASSRKRSNCDTTVDVIEKALDAISDGVVVLDLDGQIQFANAAARALLGDATHFAIPSGESLVHDRLITCTATPLDAGSIVMLRDATDHAIAARRAELAERRAEHAVHAASLAHQINNPLAIINVHAELMKDELESLRAQHREGAKRYADIAESMTEIEAAVGANTHLTSDLRAFSQPMPNARSDLRRAIDWAIRTASPALRDRARATARLAAEGSIALDEPRLGRLLVELLRNAAAAIPSGSAEKHEVVISSRAAATPGRIVVEIHDSGTGFTAADPFAPALVRTAAGVHLGLGLAECKAIVDSCGGSIAIASEPDKGTTVTVELPLK